MGNYASCALPTTGKLGKGAKVIFPSGEIRTFQQSTKAAELMLEIPNFVLVNSRSLQIGRRFSALNADEDLEIGNVYVMFPMKRLNSCITASDMDVVFVTATSKVGVVPTCSESAESEVGGGACGAEEFQHRRSSFCRSKKPLLETIVEEPMTVC